jgi:hypothetical protein
LLDCFRFSGIKIFSDREKRRRDGERHSEQHRRFDGLTDDRILDRRVVAKEASSNLKSKN